MKRAVLVTVVFASTACAASAAKREAASLAEAVGRFHRAENVDKPAAAEAVAHVACTVKDVCSAKQLCLDATDRSARGLRLKAEVQRGIDALAAHTLTPEDPEAKALPGRLQEAADLIEEGHARMPSCDASVMDLRKTYGI